MPHRDYRPHTSNEFTLWRFLFAAVVAVILLFVSSASVKAAWDMYQTFDTAAAERAATELELAALKAEYATVVATLEQFSTDRGLEAAVRERFGVVRPGEGEIRIVRTKESDVVEVEESDNPFSRLFNALFTW